MGRYANVTLTVSSMFLIVMAILVNSSALFYMATAVIATLGAARLQAYLAVRYLRFERFTAPAVQVGETVTVEIVVWSERQLKRPLISVADILPRRLVTSGLTRALPVAPSFDQPIRTFYSFKPMRRGKFRWERLIVYGNDALGLINQEQTYATDPVELTVYPAPLPVNQELQPLIGWGASDLDSGRKVGTGLEPRGVREFAQGDPLRYIHWRSSARRDKLMVKEFESGSGVTMHFLLQRQQGTETWTTLDELTDLDTSTFETMCSHTLTLATDYAKKGATVHFPLMEGREQGDSHPEARERQIREILTTIQCDALQSISQDMEAIRPTIQPGETVVCLVAAADPDLPATITAWVDVKIIVLVYEPSEFRKHAGVNSPADPSYIGRLESTGAQVILMPRRERAG